MTEGNCPLVEKPELLKVLIVDDCTEDRSRARRVFERAGLFVIEAGDGLAALQSAIEDAPHVILLAETLADPLGVDVLGGLRAEETTRAIPVATWTTRACEPSATRASATPAGRTSRRVISKSAAPATLLVQVHEILAISRARRRTSPRVDAAAAASRAEMR